MKIEQFEVTQPVIKTVAEQVIEALQAKAHLAAVLLIPSHECGLRILYRGVSGAWWKADFNEPGVSRSLSQMLTGVEKAVLITREDVDEILEELPTLPADPGLLYTPVEPGVWRHSSDDSPCESYPDSLNFTYVGPQETLICSHNRRMNCYRRGSIL
jgi:hypothetical protein